MRVLLRNKQTGSGICAREGGVHLPAFSYHPVNQTNLSSPCSQQLSILFSNLAPD